MSVTRASKSITSSKQIPTNKNTWVRPSDWVDIGTYDLNSDIFAGVYPVYNIDGNFCAVRATVSAGTYTVDWGDGVVETFTSNTTASHAYTYSAVTNPVTTRNYKTVLVKVYPTTTGSTLNQIELPVTPTGRASVATGILWLDIFATSTSVNKGYLIGTGFLSNFLGLIERVIFNNFATSYYIFSRAANIRVISALDFFGTSTLQYAFQNCQYLESIPPITNISLNSTTVYNNAFNGCSSLIEVDLPETTVATSFANTFQDCRKLTKVTGNINATTLSNTFNGCSSLKQIDATFNVSQCTTIANAFNGCVNLIELPDLSSSTTALTSAANACQNCTAITKPLVLGVTSAITTYASMYNGCLSLRVFDTQYSVAACTTLQATFSTCSALTEVINPFVGTFPGTFSATGFSQTFYNGASTPSSLSNVSITQTIPATATTYALIVPTGCILGSLSIPGLSQSFSIANNQFSATALNDLYTSLATVATSKTITVTGNYGTATDNPAIATAKNWVVTG